MLTAFLLASSAPVDAPLPKRVGTVLAKLDMTSFANSIGPRRRAGRTTLTNYGFGPLHADGTGYVTAMGDGSWRMGFIPIERDRTHLLVCFTDRALNGGSSATQDAVVITVSGDRPVGHRVDDARCPTQR